MIKETLKKISGIFLGLIFIFIGYSLSITSAGILLKSANIDNALIGIVTSAFYVGAIFSAIVGYKFVSVYGYSKSYAIFSAFFAISAMLHNFSNTLIYWTILRFMLGFSYYSIVMVVESWINACSQNEVRSRVLSFYEGTYYSSFAIGMLILSSNSAHSSIFVWSAFFIILGSIPINVMKIEEPPSPPKKRIFIPNVFRLVPLALVGSFVAGVLMNGFFSMSGVYILSKNGTLSDASMFIMIAMSGGFVSQLFFGYLSDKFGRKYSIMLASFIIVISAIVMLFCEKNLHFEKIAVFFMGIGIFCLYSLSLARANDVLKNKNKTAQIGATFLFNYIIGSLIAPVFIGVMMNLVGSSGFVWTYIIFATILFVFAHFNDVVPKHKRTNYVVRRPSKIFDE